MNCSPSTITTVTLSLPPGAIGRVDQLARRGFGIAGVPLHDLADLVRRHLIAQAVAAQQQGAIGLERNAAAPR